MLLADGSVGTILLGNVHSDSAESFSGRVSGKGDVPDRKFKIFLRADGIDRVRYLIGDMGSSDVVFDCRCLNAVSGNFDSGSSGDSEV